MRTKKFVGIIAAASAATWLLTPGFTYATMTCDQICGLPVNSCSSGAGCQFRTKLQETSPPIQITSIPQPVTLPYDACHCASDTTPSTSIAAGTTLTITKLPLTNASQFTGESASAVSTFSVAVPTAVTSVGGSGATNTFSSTYYGWVVDTTPNCYYSSTAYKTPGQTITTYANSNGTCSGVTSTCDPLGSGSFSPPLAGPYTSCTPGTAGVCGSATSTPSSSVPTSNLCDPVLSGPAAGPATLSGSNWVWQCTGLNGYTGPNTPCSTPKASCNPAHTYVDQTTCQTTEGTSCVSASGQTLSWMGSTDGGAVCSAPYTDGGPSSCAHTGMSCSTVGQTFMFQDCGCAAGNRRWEANYQCNSNTTWSCVAASCGTANGAASATVPSSNLCSAGNPSAISSTSSTWSWTCSASGQTANCSAPNTSTPGGGYNCSGSSYWNMSGSYDCMGLGCDWGTYYNFDPTTGIGTRTVQTSCYTPSVIKYQYIWNSVTNQWNYVGEISNTGGQARVCMDAC